MKWNYYIVIILFFNANSITAQINYFPTTHYQIKPITFTQPLQFDIYTPSLLVSSTKQQAQPFRAKAYCYEDLAVFCKLEVKMEKASGFPVKFRLGEVNYVEQLEGKPYSIFY